MTRAASNSELVQNYIVGRLSDTERRAFENQLLSDVSLVRDLEQSLRLREGLEILRERKELVGLERHRRRTLFTGVVRAAAAAVAVIALCVGLYYVRQSPAVVAASVAALPLSANKPLVVVESYSFATVREATQTPVLDLPSGGALELRALTSATGGGRTFRATLEEIRGEEPFRLGAAEHLAPDADGFVAIYADTSHLQPGDYSLIVQSDVEDKTSAERFAFRLKRPAGATPEGH
jgi:hypothetical protein